MDLGVRRSQSAMEYLMTYGWAILIIAIVLAALFSLGVFGSGGLGAKAPPGSCRVFRPQGPGTTTNINLQGVCTGVKPQYVAVFNGAGYIGLTPSSVLQPSQQVTVSAWYYETTGLTASWYDSACSNGYPIVGFYSRTSCWAQGYMLLLGRGAGDTQYAITSNGVEHTASTGITTGSWVFMAGTLSGSTITLYLNGQQAATGSNTGITYTGVVGNVFSVNTNRPIYLANVQVYNTGLDASSIAALYQEGVGGAPVSPQYLVGWWPLNGDTNDYSGNGNNGVPVGVTFSTNYPSS